MSEHPRTPFISREEFEEKKRLGQLEPDALFPNLNYDFCKYVWDHSPLIAHLDKTIQDEIEARRILEGKG